MSKKKKVLLIVLTVLIVLVLGGLLTAYAVFKHYYGMMNHEEDEIATLSAPENTEEETVDAEDSPESEIQDLEKQLEENLKAASQDIPYDKDVYNILLFGTDSRQNTTRERADSMILVSINRKEKRITMTSLMRDIYVTIPGVGNNRLNAANTFGGAPLLLDTIEQNLGVKIDDYVQVNFYAFADVIDAVGGVDLDVTAEEIEAMAGSISWQNQLLGRNSRVLTAEDAGNVHLDGNQALAFCRIRYLKGSDFQRTRRQRDVLLQVFRKAKGCSLGELNDLMKVLLPNLTTNISEGKMISLILDSGTILKYDLETDRIPVDGSFKDLVIGRKMVLGIDFEENRKALQDIIYGTR